MKTKKRAHIRHRKRPILLTLSAYAKKRGVSHQAVSKAVREGRITLVRGKIDPKRADAELRLNRDPARDPFRKGPGRPVKGPKVSRKKGTYLDARIRKEHYQAEIARLEFETRTGKLVDTEKVKKAAFDSARQVRDNLLNIPGRISASLAAKTDSFEIEIILKNEIRLALETLVKGNGTNGS
ncbi:MAG: hypothetical protein QME66_04590 [Candidatus Eisenbacteria bacterium]|nr:hypothetical protein [Candidatus Eisenbacteria bacterium]